MFQKILLKQGFLNSILTFLLIGLTLLIVTLQIKILGINNYGCITLLLSVFGTIEILNLGSGSALVSYFSKSKELFWDLCSFIFLMILIFSLMLCFVGSFFYAEIYRMLSIEQHSMGVYAYWGSCFIGISRLLMSLISNYWVAKLEYVKFKIFNFFIFNNSILLIIAFYYYGFSTEKSIYFSGIINIIGSLLFFSMLYLTQKETYFIRITRCEIKKFLQEIFSFQMIALLSTLATPLLNSLISYKFGLNYVSYFDISIRFLTAGRQVIIALIEPFFSGMTRLYHLKKNRMAYLLTQKYTFYCLIISGVYFITAYILSPFILSLWLGQEFARFATPITQNLALGFAFTITSSVIYRYFLSFNYGRTKALMYQIILLLFLIIIYFLEISIKNIDLFFLIYNLSLLFSSVYLLFCFKKLRKVHF